MIRLKKTKSSNGKDEDLVEKAIKGDKSSIEILINEHKEYLYKMAFLYLKDEDEAIDILEEKYKTPIILQYFHDMEIKEIARILDCNENTVKTNLRRGRERLYRILKEGR